MKMRKSLTLIASLAVLSGEHAVAQQADLVVDQRGKPASPWIETTGCVDEMKTNCMTILYNTKSHEIAKAGDKLSTKFVATGLGKEIRRAETTKQQAQRNASKP